MTTPSPWRFGQWWMSAVCVLGLLIGCGVPSANEVPLPTDGPNQVVLKVPYMT
jgi:hypothetical protein